MKIGTLPPNSDTTGIITDPQWDTLLRAPITGTECAFVSTPETEQERIVVIYNARNAPPIVTMDINDTTTLVTLKADGTPIAVMSCKSDELPDIEDVMLVARHVPHNS